MTDAHFHTLNRCLDSGDYVAGLKQVSEIIKGAPANLKAWQCRVYIWNKLERFNETVNVDETIKKNGGPAADAITSDDYIIVSKCYALYRLNRYKECMSMINQQKLTGDHAKEVLEHLNAQTLYKIGEYPQAAKLYEKICDSAAKNKNSGIDLDDILVNRMASYISSGNAKKAIATANSNADSEEWVLLFNKATALLLENDLDEAFKVLNHAKKLVEREYAEYYEEGDDADDEVDQEKREDMRKIDSQLAVLYQKRGDSSAAQKLYDAIAHPGSTVVGQSGAKNAGTGLDPASLVCIANNRMALKPEQLANKFLDTLKRMTKSGGLESKFTKLQIATLNLNKICILLKTKKVKEAHQLYQQMKHDLQELPNPGSLVLVEAAIAYHEKNVSKCEQILSNNAESAEAASALAELYSGVLKDEEKALAFFKKLPAAGRADTCNAICGFLYRKKEYEQISETIMETTEGLKKDIGSKKDTPLHSKLKTICDAGLKWGLTLKDLTLVENICVVYLKEINPKSEVYLLHMMQVLTKKALASNDLGQTKDILKQMNEYKSIYDRVSGVSLDLELEVDPEELEMTLPKVEKQEATTGGDLKKRKRKIRWPKGIDPANLPEKGPDPERWLPKYERTGYRAKNKKGKFRGPQGAANGDQKAGPSTAGVAVAGEVIQRKNKKKKK